MNSLARKLISRFCESSKISLSQLKCEELTRPLNLKTAKLFVSESKRFTPYVETISHINKLLSECNNVNNKKHLQALWDWRYNLVDVLPLCHELLSKEGLQDHQLDFLAMMAASHPAETTIVTHTLKVIKDRVDAETATIRDLKKIVEISSTSKANTHETLKVQTAKQLMATEGVEDLSQVLFVLFSEKAANSYESPTAQKGFKKQLLSKIASRLPAQIDSLSQRQRGQVIGDVLSSMSPNQIEPFIVEMGSFIKTTSEESFLEMLEFARQFMFILSKSTRIPDKKGVHKLMSVIEWEKEKYSESEQVQEALEVNRYLLQVLMLESEINRGLNSKGAIND